jgi:Na+/melibiose symporter-like transporter
VLAAAVLICSAALWLLLSFVGGKRPLCDAFTNVLSVAAMILTVRRMVEQWMMWIAVDAIEVFMWWKVWAESGNSVALLLMWQPGNPALSLRLMTDGKLTINLYTVAFLLLFGIGYGAYYSTADMPIPMVADCADYETYCSGKFIPGIMGTLFSLVDKLVSSLSSTVVFLAVSFIGYQGLPTKATPYMDGMNWVVIALFCIVPMVAWAVTLLAMRGYELDGNKVKTIQAVNIARKNAISNGMSMEEAMQTITDETVAK